MLTMQEIFTKVASHLLTQKRRAFAILSTNDAPRCAYRGDDGTRCAAGCLIEDAYYFSSFEGAACDDGGALRALVKSGVNMHDETTRDLVRALQVIHDNKPPERWLEELNWLANDFNLEMPTS